MLRTSLLTVALAASLAAQAQTTPADAAKQRAPQPAAPIGSASDTYFGTAVEDPYRNLENRADPAVASWMRIQSDYAHRTLASLPGRAALLAAMTKYDGAVTERVAQVVRVPKDRWFVERRGATENQFKLYVRDGLKGKDRLLVDPEALEKETGKPHAINYYTPADDGATVAYGLSQQGSEAASLQLLDVKTGGRIGPPIERADYGAVSWAADGRRFVFNRLQEMKPGMAEVEKFQNSRVWLMTVGGAIGEARPVLGSGMPGVDIGPAEAPTVELTADGRWAIGTVFNGTERDRKVFVSPQRALLAGRPQWVKLFGAEAQITGTAYAGDMLYVVSHAGAPRSKVLAIDLRKPSVADARTVVATSDRVVTGIAGAADALYIEARDGNVKRLYAQPYLRGKGVAAPAREVRLPVEGSFALNDDNSSAANPRVPGVVVVVGGWTRAQQVYAVAADGSVANTGLQPQGPYDSPTDIVATEVKVRAADGAMVPMSIIHKKGIRLDGDNPTLLYGYASYGITEEPYYSNSRLAWLEAGGVWAVANPRGSSVYGQDWYKGGFQQSKANTWKDFIACAEYLVSEKYTRPARLGILGGSAGGILVGRAMTARPDLFAAVIDAVGVNDTVRAESTPNGVPNIPEFGTVKTEPGFRSLLEMSTYAAIKPGVAYPAALFTHGVNDPRVEVWMSTKAAAKLQASTSSGKPVLLRLDYDAGHGIGNTKKQQLEERADMFAFLLWQMGVVGYQP